jgi:hypothetical protein
MRSVSIRLRTCCVLASLAIAAVLAGQPACAQDKPADASRARAKSAEQGKAAARRGILPPYFRGVVDEKQRDAIYKIQEEYGAKIAALKAQLEAATKERDAKIAALLTPEQKNKLEQLQTEAKVKREQGAAAKTSSTKANVQKAPEASPAK